MQLNNDGLNILVFHNAKGMARHFFSSTASPNTMGRPGYALTCVVQEAWLLFDESSYPAQAFRPKLEKVKPWSKIHYVDYVSFAARIA